MKIGSIVKSIHSDTYGVVRKDELNFSVHYWADYDDRTMLAKSIGYNEDVLLQYWKVVDLPHTHYIDIYGLPKRKVVYISGQMSNLPNYNKEQFNSYAYKLRKLGYEVVNPAEVEGSEYWKWEDFMKYDIAEMMKCTTVAKMDNWKYSRGATIEVELAENLGMEVVEIDSLLV